MTGPADRSDAAEPGEPLDDDERWLRAREEGSALPPLAADRAAAYDALTEMVRTRAQLGAPLSARDELRATLDREEARRRRATRLRRAAVVATAAGAVIAIAIWFGARRPASSLVVTIEDQLVRAGSASGRAVGDPQGARVEATVIVDASHPELKELRLYRDGGEIVARCPGHAGCTGGGTHWKLTMRFDAPGRYRVIRVDKAAVEPTGGYDADMVALRSAGAVVDANRTIDVR